MIQKKQEEEDKKKQEELKQKQPPKKQEELKPQKQQSQPLQTSIKMDDVLKGKFTLTKENLRDFLITLFRYYGIPDEKIKKFIVKYDEDDLVRNLCFNNLKTKDLSKLNDKTVKPQKLTQLKNGFDNDSVSGYIPGAVKYLFDQ